tara:strand:+ start:24231 stop:24872 length:642 start_codon:yes stop_codon:yes gene_type:complete
MADCCPKFLPDHSHSNTILSGGKTVETSQTGTNFKGRYKTEEGLDEKNQTKATTQSGTAGSSSTKAGESNGLKDKTEEGLDVKNQTKETAQSGTSGSSSTKTGTSSKSGTNTEDGLDVKNQTKETAQSGTSGSSSTKTGESNSLKDTTGATTRTQKSGIRTDKEERGGAVNLKASTGGGDNDETVFEDESAVVTFKVIVKGFLATTQSICPAE